MKTLDRIGLGGVALAGLITIFIGARFLVAPEIAAAGFGVPARVTSDSAAYLAAKGVRDIAWGFIVLGLLPLRQFKALAVVLVAEAFVAVSDLVVVLVNGGTSPVALGTHGLAAILLIGLGLGVWTRSTPRTASRLRKIAYFVSVRGGFLDRRKGPGATRGGSRR